MAIPKKQVSKIDSFIDSAKATKADNTTKNSQEAEEIINFRLPKSLIKKIKVHAAIEEKDLKVLAKEVFEDYFKDKVVSGI